MKRLTALLLAAVLALSLVACGNGDSNGGSSEPPEETTMTEEEMLAIATDITASEIVHSFSENQAKANETFLNNTFLISGITISSGEIKSDHVLCDHGLIRFKYILPNDDLVNLSSGADKEIVGTISNIYTEQEDYMGTMTDIIYIEVNPAFLVS